jgi:riboflavin kinase / FMN adenylyltransferase
VETYYITKPDDYIGEKNTPIVLALGFFDGVHLGHQKVINSAISIAKDQGAKAAVMTFHPHPTVVLRQDNHVSYITPLKEKLERISDLGVEICFVIKFEEDFAKLTPQQFVDKYIIAYQTIHVVAGFDFSYGALGRGTMETLPFHSRGTFSQSVIGKVEKEAVKISSTLIRQLIAQGNVATIPEYLGRHYSVCGTVVHGEKRGRTIGFPTANVKLDNHYICPENGVYSVKIKVLDQVYEGVCNIGHKPTFHNDYETSIEVHIFNFASDIYGEKITIEWHKRIRTEKKFSSVDDLVRQIKEDKTVALTYFENI